MRRREFITLLGGIALSFILVAGVANARPRIGLLTLGSPQDGPKFIAAFVDGLRKLRYL